MKTLRALHLYRTYFPETQGGLEEAIPQLFLGTQKEAVGDTMFALARPHNLYLPY